MPTRDKSAVPAPEWPRWLFRISLTLSAILLFAQSVTAGLFMARLHTAFAVHREGATVAGVAVMLSVVAAILCVRLRRDVRWPVAATVGLLGLMSLQAFAGFRSMTALHIPLGVVTIGVASALAVWAWIRDPQPRVLRSKSKQA